MTSLKDFPPVYYLDKVTGSGVKVWLKPDVQSGDLKLYNKVSMLKKNVVPFQVLNVNNITNFQLRKDVDLIVTMKDESRERFRFSSRKEAMSWATLVKKFRKEHKQAVKQKAQNKRSDSVSSENMISSAEAIILKLRNAIKESGTDLAEAFLAIDADESGSIDRGEFRELVLSIVSLTDKEFTILFSVFDADGDGTINYDEFNSLLFADEPSSSEDETPAAPADVATPTAQPTRGLDPQALQNLKEQHAAEVSKIKSDHMSIVDSLRRKMDENQAEANNEISSLRSQLRQKENAAATRERELQEELDELKQEVEELKAGTDDARNDSNALKEQAVLLKRAEKLKAAAQDKLNQATRELEEERQAKKSLEANMAKARQMFQEQKDALQNQVDELKRDLADTNESFSMLQVESDMHKASAQQNERFSEENSVLHDQLSQAQVQLAEQARAADEAVAEAADVADKLRSDLRAAHEESDDLAARLEESEELVQELREKIAEDAEDALRAAEQAAALHKELKDEISELKSSHRGTKQEATSEAQNLRAQIKSLERQVEQKSDLLSDALAENSNLVNDIASLREQLSVASAEDVEKLRATVSTLSSDLRRERARSAKLAAENDSKTTILREKGLLDEDTVADNHGSRDRFEVGDVVECRLHGTKERACCIVYEVFDESYGVQVIGQDMKLEQVHADDVRKAAWIRVDDMNTLIATQQTSSGGQSPTNRFEPSASIKIATLETKLQSTEESLRNVQRDAVTAISAVSAAGRGTANGEQLAAALRVFESRLAAVESETQQTAMAQVTQQVARAEERIAAERDRVVAATKAESEALLERLTATLTDTRAKFTNEVERLTEALEKEKSRARYLEDDLEKQKLYNSSIAGRMQALALVRLFARRRTQRKQRALITWQRAADVALIQKLRHRCSELEREKLRLIEQSIRQSGATSSEGDDFDGHVDDRLGISHRSRRASSPQSSFAAPSGFSNARPSRRQNAHVIDSTIDGDALFDGLSAALSTLNLPNEYAAVLDAARDKASAALQAVRDAAQEYRQSAVDAMDRADSLDRDLQATKAQVRELETQLSDALQKAVKDAEDAEAAHNNSLHQLSQTLQDAKQDEKQRAVAAVRSRYRAEAIAEAEGRAEDAKTYQQEIAALKREVADMKSTAAEHKLRVERTAQEAVTHAREAFEAAKEQLDKAHSNEVHRLQVDNEHTKADATSQLTDAHARVERVKAELYEALAEHKAASANSTHGLEMSKKEHDHILRMKDVERQLALEEQRNQLAAERSAAETELKAAHSKALTEMAKEHEAELLRKHEQFTKELSVLSEDSRELLLKKLGHQHTEMQEAHEARLAALAAHAAEQADATAQEMKDLAERHQGDLESAHKHYDEILDATGTASSVAAGDARHAKRYQERQNAKMYRSIQAVIETEVSAADAEELKKLTLESMVEALQTEVVQTLRETEELEAESEANDTEARAQMTELHNKHQQLQARLDDATAAHAEQTQRMQMTAEERAAADQQELAKVQEVCQELESQLADAKRDVAVASSVGLSQADIVASVARPLLAQQQLRDAVSTAAGDGRDAYGVAIDPSLRMAMKRQASALNEVVEVARECGHVKNENASLRQALQDAADRMSREHEASNEQISDLQFALRNAEERLKEAQRHHDMEVSQLKEEAAVELDKSMAQHEDALQAFATEFDDSTSEARESAAAAALAMAAQHREHIADLELEHQIRLDETVSDFEQRLEREVSEADRSRAELARATEAAHALSSQLSQRELDAVKERERLGYQRQTLEHELASLQADAAREIDAANTAHSQSVAHLQDYRSMSEAQLATVKAEANKAQSELRSEIDAVQRHLKMAVAQHAKAIEDERSAAMADTQKLEDALERETSECRMLETSLRDSLHRHEDQLGQSTRERKHVLNIQELTFDKERISLEAKCSQYSQEVNATSTALADAQAQLVHRNGDVLRLESALVEAQEEHSAAVAALQEELDAARDAVEDESRTAAATVASLEAQHATAVEVAAERTRNAELLHEAALQDARRVHEQEQAAAQANYERMLREYSDKSREEQLRSVEKAQLTESRLQASIEEKDGEVESLQVSLFADKKRCEDELRAAQAAAEERLHAAEQRAAHEVELVRLDGEKRLLEEHHALQLAKEEWKRVSEANKEAMSRQVAHAEAMEVEARNARTNLQEQVNQMDLERSSWKLQEAETRSQLIAEHKQALAAAAQEFQEKLSAAETLQAELVTKASSDALSHTHEVHALEKKLISLEAQRDTALQRVADLTERVSDLTMSHKEDQSRWAAVEAELKAKFAAAQSQFEVANQEASDAYDDMRTALESRVQSLEVQVQDEHEAAEGLAADLQATKAQLARTKEDADREVSQLRSRGESYSTALKELRAETNQLAQLKLEAEQHHAEALRTLKSEHQHALRELQLSHDKFLSEKTGSLEGVLQKERMEHSYQLKAKEAEVVQMHMQHLAAIDNLKSSLQSDAKEAEAAAALEHQREAAVHAETTQHLEHIAETKGAQVDQLQARCEELTAALHTQQQESRDADQRMMEARTELERELAEVRKTTDAELAQMQTSLSSELAAAHADAARRLDEASAAFDRKRSEITSKFQSDMDAVTKQSSSEISQLRREVDAARAGAAESARLVAESESARQLVTAQCSDLQSQIEVLSGDHAQQMTFLREKLDQTETALAAADNQLREAERAHASSIKALSEQVDHERSSAAAVESKLHKAQLHFHQQLAAVKSDWSAEKASLQKAASQEIADLRSQLSDAIAEHRVVQEQQRHEATRSLAAVEAAQLKRISEFEASVQAKQKEIVEQLQADFKRDFEGQQQKHESLLSQEREAADAAQARLRDAHKRAMAELEAKGQAQLHRLTENARIERDSLTAAAATEAEEYEHAISELEESARQRLDVAERTYQLELSSLEDQATLDREESEKALREARQKEVDEARRWADKLKFQALSYEGETSRQREHFQLLVQSLNKDREAAAQQAHELRQRIGATSESLAQSQSVARETAEQLQVTKIAHEHASKELQTALQERADLEKRYASDLERVAREQQAAYSEAQAKIAEAKRLVHKQAEQAVEEAVLVQRQGHIRELQAVEAREQQLKRHLDSQIQEVNATRAAKSKLVLQAKKEADKYRSEIASTKSELMAVSADFKKRLVKAEAREKERAQALQQSVQQADALNNEVERLRATQQELALQAELAEADRAHFEQLHDSAVRIAQTNLMQDRQSAIDVLNDEFGRIMHQSMLSDSQQKKLHNSLASSQNLANATPSVDGTTTLLPPPVRSVSSFTPAKMTVDQLQLPTPQQGFRPQFGIGSNFAFPNPDASFLVGSAQTPLAPNNGSPSKRASSRPNASRT